MADKNEWKEWIESPEGRKCKDNMPTSLMYLENRLWWAFTAGYQAALKEAKEKPLSAEPTR